MELPNEEVVKRETRRDFAKLFDYAEQSFQVAANLITEEKLNKPNLPMVTKQLAFALTGRAVRQFRTAVQLCERREAEDAIIIVRSMFETLLAIHFLLVPKFIPRKYNKKGKAQETIREPGKRLTREFRACLYGAHYMLSGERFYDRFKEMPGMKRAASRRRKECSLETRRRVLEMIGPGWEERLQKQPYTYSGLNIQNLARSLKKSLAAWYQQLYPIQSEIVHSANSPDYLRWDEEDGVFARWQSPPEKTREALLWAITMFNASIAAFSKYCDLGVEIDSAFAALLEKHRVLTRGQ